MVVVVWEVVDMMEAASVVVELVVATPVVEDLVESVLVVGVEDMVGAVVGVDLAVDI